MTMQNLNHPPEERLAALAGGDPEAAADGALRAHVQSCAACSGEVDELGMLRAALSELPDLVPSRQLQLVPPVPTANPRRGWLGALRGLAAPAMALGAGLAVVGAVGLGGQVLGGAAAGAAPAISEESDSRGSVQGPSMQPNDYGPQTPAPAAQGDQSGESREAFPANLVDTSTPAPWLVLVVTGAILLAGGLGLRFVINPRAG